MTSFATGILVHRGRFTAMPGFRWTVVTFGTLIGGIPQIIRDAFLVASLFIFLDTLSGLLLAAKCKQVRSNKMRLKLTIKLVQYALIVGLGGGVGLIMHQWGPVGAALGAVVSIEGLSIIENVLMLERCGGAPLGPARPLLLKLEKYFAVTNDDPPSGDGENRIDQ